MNGIDADAGLFTGLLLYSTILQPFKKGIKSIVNSFFSNFFLVYTAPQVEVKIVATFLCWTLFFQGFRVQQ